MRIRFCLASIFLISGALFSQTSDPFNFTQLENQPSQGFLPTGTYAFSNIETIGVTSGNLMLHIPIANLPPGRGKMPGPGISLHYNSKSTESIGTANRVWTCSSPVIQGTVGTNLELEYLTYTLGSDNPWTYAGYLYTLHIITRSANFTSDIADTNSVGCAAPSSSNVSLCQTEFGAHAQYRNWHYQMEFPDGSMHELLLNGAPSADGYYNVDDTGTAYVCNANGTAPVTSSYGAPLVFSTVDGTYGRLVINTSDATGNTWVLSFPDGRQVSSVGTGSNSGETVTDRNDNSYTVTGACSGTSSYLSCPILTTTIEDGVGRTLTLEQNYTSSPLSDTITVQGVGGTPLVWTVDWTSITSNISYQPYDAIPSYGGSTTPPNQTLGQLLLLQSLQLPSQLGGQSFTFSYLNTGEQPATPQTTNGTASLRQITLPTGATANYNYVYEDCKAGSTSACAINGSLTSYESLIRNSPTKKTVTCPDCGYNGASYSETWTYALPPGNVNVSIIAPDGGSTIHRTYSGLTYRTESYDQTGALQQIDEQVWSQNPLNGSAGCPSSNCMISGVNNQPSTTSYVSPLYNPFVSSTYKTLSGGTTPVAIQQFTEDPNSNQLSATEYTLSTTAVSRSSIDNQPLGIGNATTLRQTSKTYNVPVNSSYNLCAGSLTYCDTASPNVMDELLSQTISAAGSSISTRSDFCYDSAGKGNVVFEAQGSSGAAVATCSNGSGSATSSALTSTSYGYDNYGNVSQATDGRGTITAYTYGAVGSVSSLYPTQIVAAQGQTEQETTGRSYDFNTGLTLSETDPNSITATTTYDVPGRPTLVTRAGVSVQNTYSLDLTKQYVIRQHDLNTSLDGALMFVERYNALSHVKLTQQLEAAESVSTLATDTTSGILTQHLSSLGSTGNYEVVSNPYRSASDATMGWTLTSRDALARLSAVTHYSGANPPAPWGTNSSATGTATSAYSGNTITVTDEAGKARTNTVDAQGRLTNVVEDPNATSYTGLNYSTTYAYDILNDLSGVAQGVQGRTFSYDSLKRLISATNPESGTICYGSITGGVCTAKYDANGNLLQKTDNRGAVTNYSNYDHLNRLTSKTYTGASGTSSAAYQYDGTGGSCPVAANAVGHLTTASATSASASTPFQTAYNCYDAFGRVTQSTQTTAGQPYPFSYVYNLDGGPISVTYPSGRIVTTGYDGAGRPNSVTGAVSGLSTPYASGVTYAPQGGVAQINLHNGLSEQTTYNPRLQPGSIQLGSLLTLTYGYSSTNNNGNVASQTIASPLTTGGTLTAQQVYTYDGVNRLLSTQETVQSGQPSGTAAGNWTLNDGNDQYGNHWATTALPMGPAMPTLQTQFNATVNRLSERSTNVALPSDAYDAAGNLQDHPDIGQMTYDAENRLLTFTNTNIGTVAAYDYDGEGRRVRKVVAGTSAGTTVYVNDAAGQLTAEIVPAGSDPDTGTRYLTADHLGSTRAVTDGSGNLVDRMDYFPFGQTIPSGQSFGNRNLLMGYGAASGVTLEFTGKEMDGESGLDYFGARYFSGLQGRFTSPDSPFADQNIAYPQTLNLYAYVRNNPLRLVDRGGTDAEESVVAQLLDLLRFSKSQIAGRVTGGLIEKVAPIANTFDAPSKIPVFRGGLDRGRETQEAYKASQFAGMSLVGMPKQNFPGIDGIFLESTWLGFGPYNAVPVSLKGFDSPPTPADVVRAALSAFDQITSASETYQQIRRAQIFIDAPTLASKEITDTKGFQFIGGTTKGPVVERVVIFSKDGYILCERGQCSR